MGSCPIRGVIYVRYRVFIDSKQGDILLKIVGHPHSPDLIRFFRAFTRFFLRDLYSGSFHVSTGDYKYVC